MEAVLVFLQLSRLHVFICKFFFMCLSHYEKFLDARLTLSHSQLLIFKRLFNWGDRVGYLLFACLSKTKSNLSYSKILRWSRNHRKSHRKKRTHRSSRPEVFCKQGVLKIFTKFTGKYLCQSLFFNKVAGLKNTFFYRTPPEAASGLTNWGLKIFCLWKYFAFVKSRRSCM